MSIVQHKSSQLRVILKCFPEILSKKEELGLKKLHECIDHLRDTFLELSDQVLVAQLHLLLHHLGK